MLNEIKKHIAALALELQVDINYEFHFGADSPTTTWPQSREQHRISGKGYKYLYRVSAEQILNITVYDFIREDSE